MREFKKNFKIETEERILWLCVLLERILGINSFAHMRILHSGIYCVMDAPVVRQAAQAIFNLRMLGLGMDNPTAVKSAIEDYLNYHYCHHSGGEYEIDANALTFERKNFIVPPPRLVEIERLLSQPAPFPGYNYATASAQDNLYAKSMESAPIPLDPVDIVLPAPVKHTHAHRPAGVIRVPLLALLGIAREMDDREEAAPAALRAGDWRKRLNAIVFQRCAAGGLAATDELELKACIHLLGVPGVGKTSLLIVLAVWLGRAGYRVMMVLPTIELSAQVKERLQFHQVRAAMLAGESPNTRYRHYKRNAETIASQFGHGGFGGSLSGGADFAANCALQSYAISAHPAWHYGHAPCGDLTVVGDRGGQKKMLCPLFSGCGRQTAARARVGALVWLGHIKSMDTHISPYTSDFRMRYFEYVARNFDVVFFDEADAIQADLDSEAAYRIELVGTDNGLMPKNVGQIDRLVTGLQSHNLGNCYVETFGLTSSLVKNLAFRSGAILLEMKRNAAEVKAVEFFADQLLTSAKMITDVFCGMEAKSKANTEAPDDPSSPAAQRMARRRSAIIDLWDRVTYSAMTAHIGKSAPPWSRSAAVAASLDMPIDEIESIDSQLIGHLRNFLWASPLAAREEVSEITAIMKNLCFPGQGVTPKVEAGLKLLTPITLLIIGYRRLVNVMRKLPLDPDLIDVGSRTVSPELQRLIPESLAGPLSGMKYSLTQSQREGEFNMTIEHITIKGAPRLYLHNFHRLYEHDGVPRGPIVILVSATSYIEDSPSFHILTGPHYVLQRKTDEASNLGSSVWAFIPQLDDRPAGRGRRYLNFSGAGEARMNNLAQMVLKLLRGGVTDSQVYRDMRRHDVRDGIGRKAALIVNSYEQARHVKAVIDANFPDLRSRTVVVVREPTAEELDSQGYISTAAVESVGDREACDIVIFAMAALQRSVNIVRTHGPRHGEAAIGHLYFLTRPHPSGDDMQFLLGLLGRQTQEFSNQIFGPDKTLDDISDAYMQARRSKFRDIAEVLREPVIARRLTFRLYRQFVANQIVPLLQMIGRGTRGGCSVWVNFVDAAWAPHSAVGEPDDARSSMLVMMRDILAGYVNHPESLRREIYTALFAHTLDAMHSIDGLLCAAPEPEKDELAASGDDKGDGDLEPDDDSQEI